MLIAKNIFILLLGFINIYIYLFFIRKLDIKDIFKKIIKYTLIVLTVGQSLYLFSRHSDILSQEYTFLFSYGLWISGMILIVAIIYHLLYYLNSKIKYSPNRRDIIKKSLDGAAIVSSGTLLTASFDHFHIPETKNYNIKIDNMNSFKIAQLTDMHIGNSVKKEYIAQVVTRTNLESPDIIVITGDLIDYDLEFIKDDVIELKKLKSKYGIYFILGNHDYFHKPKEIIDFLSSIGIRTLINESIIINNSFNLVGLCDNINGWHKIYKIDIDKAFMNIDKSIPTITLAHQPKVIYRLKKYNPDLVISGHTHGGQVYPYAILFYLQQPYIQGLYRHSNTSQIFISSGVGFWGPAARLFTQNEIAILNIN